MEDSDSAPEIIEPSAVQPALNTSVKETPKKTVETPVKNAETPKNIVPKKSAFDFLMNKKKAQLNESFSRGADSDSECIVLDTSRSACDSPKPRSPSAFFTVERKPKNSPAFKDQQPEKQTWMDFVDDPLFQTHQRQFNGKYEQFFDSKSQVRIRVKDGILSVLFQSFASCCLQTLYRLLAS